jgi:hypothetical protein
MGRKLKYTKEEIIDFLKSIGKSVLSKTDIDKNDKIPFSSATLTRYFGSWNSALIAAGLDHGKAGRKKKIELNKTDE